MESYQDGNKNEPNKRELITDISNITEEEMRSVFNFLDLDGNEVRSLDSMLVTS